MKYSKSLVGQIVSVHLTRPTYAMRHEATVAGNSGHAQFIGMPVPDENGNPLILDLLAVVEVSEVLDDGLVVKAVNPDMDEIEFHLTSKDIVAVTRISATNVKRPETTRAVRAPAPRIVTP